MNAICCKTCWGAGRGKCLDDDEVDEEVAAGGERGAQDLGDARGERQHQADLGEHAAALRSAAQRSVITNTEGRVSTCASIAALEGGAQCVAQPRWPGQGPCMHRGAPVLACHVQQPG